MTFYFTFVRNHEPPKLYDIVHFDHKLSRFYFLFSQKEIVFITYNLVIFFLISQCETLPNHPPLRSLEPLNKVHHLFDTWVTFDYTSEAHNFFVQHLRVLLT